MIRCENVHKSYAGHGGQAVHALRGVDLRIDSPGYYAIMGASGSGKTTLMHLLAALDTPDEGTISVDGHDLHTMNDKQLTAFRQRHIGIVFQQFNLIPTLTARENIELPGVLAGQSQAWLKKRSDELLDAIGVAHRASHRPDALSGGEQQRVAIARALLFSPSVVLADEPTGNLDSHSAARLWALLGQVASEHNVTVVMITHEPAAAAHCQRVHVLADGQMAGYIDTEGSDASGLATRYQQLVGQA